MGRIILADNVDVLPELADGSADLIYVDPPFNTGEVQSRTCIRTVGDAESGDRTGFQGKRYRTVTLGTQAFPDAFDDLLTLLEPRLRQSHRILAPAGYPTQKPSAY